MGDGMDCERWQRAAQEKEVIKKWVVHIVGQDDFFECRDEITALRNANEINQDIAELAKDRHPDDPFVMAIAKTIDAV